MYRKFISFVCVVTLALASTSYGVVIGNWEGSDDGWTSPAGTLTNSETVGVTLDSYSAGVDLSGWGQALKYQFGAPSNKALFMQNDTFSIDFGVAASGGAYTAGYTHLQKIIMNNASAGWVEVGGGGGTNPMATLYWWAEAGERTTTVTVDYSAYVANITDVNPDGTGTGYIEIIIETQTGGGAPSQMYFDKAELIPEPATIALLGLGALALRRRKR